MKTNYKIKERKPRKVIDIRDLADEDARLIKQFVDFLRRKKEPVSKKKAEKIAFRSWPLKVRGKLTREEIYEHL